MQILIGVDLAKPGCEWLVDRGAGIAALVRGRVDLVFVGSPSYQPALDALLARLPEPVRGTGRIMAGDVVETLTRTTGTYDLLMVGPREPGLIEMMLRGSFAMRVVRGARCAVLVPKKTEPWRKPARALVGVDLTVVNRVLEPAQVWAKRLGARIDLVSAETRLPWVDDAVDRDRMERALARERAEARDKVGDLIDTLAPGLRGSQRYADGKPEDVLSDLSIEYDVIMVGNASRPGFTGQLQWSIGEAVVRGAQCDVLTLPSTR